MFVRPAHLAVVISGLLLAMGCLVACNDKPAPRTIRLSPPSSPVVHGDTSQTRYQVPLRVAIAPIVSPRRSYRFCDRFLDYLADQLQRPVQRIQRNTYAEVNNLVRYGACDLALTGSYAYIQGQRDFGLELLVVPVINGQSTYHAYVIVPRDSSVQHIHDLQGKTFAFVDPLSVAGYLTPGYILRQMQETPGTFFNRTVYTYSHDKSIMAVSEKLVDGAAIHSLVYQAMMESSGLPDAKKVRVIYRSPPYGMSPIVVHPRMDPHLRQQLKQLFLQMHQTPQGAIILQESHIDRFEEASDALYDSVRRIAQSMADWQ